MGDMIADNGALTALVITVAGVLLVALGRLAIWMVRRKIETIDKAQDKTSDSLQSLEKEHNEQNKQIYRNLQLMEKRLDSTDRDVKKVQGSLDNGQKRFDSIEGQLSHLASTAVTSETCTRQHIEHQHEHSRLNKRLDSIETIQVEQKTMLAGLHGEVQRGFKTLTDMNSRLTDLMLERHEKERSND